MALVFLDCETVGLELHHDVWEIGWAVDDGAVCSSILPHSLKNADPKALELNGYWTRFPKGARAETPAIDYWLRIMLEGATIVGANPAFDAMRLQLRWAAQPWHYRLLDICAMAVQAFGLRGDGKVPGLADVADWCRRFADIPEPDHTAAGDVATTRACYEVLCKLRDHPVRYVTGIDQHPSLEDSL